ncbi:MAG: DUF87 domain-containing protein [Clostridia bacterium]|nr:DUF87 domain-containing protein [Clostridia bacterium]
MKNQKIQGQKSRKRKVTQARNKAPKDLKTSLIEKIFNHGNPLPYTSKLPVGFCYADGILSIDNNIYSCCISFDDINYQLRSDKDKVDILEKYVELINGFTEDSYDIQLLCYNQKTSTRGQNRTIVLKHRNDGFDYLRDEYSNIISNQIASGNNGVVRQRFFVVSVKADDINQARRKLNQFSVSITTNFSRLKVNSKILDRNEYIDLLRLIVFGKELKSFCNISWEIEKIYVNKFIQPDEINYSVKHFQINNVYNRVSSYHIIANKLNDRLLNDILNAEFNVSVSFHIKVIEQEEALNIVRGKWVDCNAELVAAQRDSVMNFYDSSLVSPNIKRNSDGVDMLLNKLESSNEKMFWVTVTIMNSSDNLDNLTLEWETLRSIVARSSNKLNILSYLQEDGFINSLPLGLNLLPQYERNLTTYTLAIFEPFTTKELNSNSPEALHYGINAISKNVIALDRKDKKEIANPNGLTFGAPGMGKSMATKLEILKSFLVTNDYIYIFDPEGEYDRLVENLGGQVIRLSPTSKDYINMFDISYSYSSNAISSKISFFETIMEQMLLGSGYSVSGDIRSVLKRAISEAYSDYKYNSDMNNMPVLEDIYNILKKQDHPASKFIVPYIDYYIGGDDDYLNHQTNVNLSNRIVSFNFNEIINNKRELAIVMLIVIDYIWARVADIRKNNKYAWVYIDEFHILLNHPQTSAYMVDFWKRFRKWNGIPTGITQNVKDLLLSPVVNNILDNTLFLTLLSQGSDDLKILSQKLELTSYQTEYLSTNRQGIGLFKYNADIIPFSNVIPNNTQIYKLITTDPKDKKKLF